MLHKILSKLDSIKPFPEAKAHCDIPCGIYDPIIAQIAALTVIRMIDLIEELEKTHGDNKDAEYHNSMARYVMVKEEHGIKCKEEIRIIWGEYMKPHHIEQFPELHSIAFNIMQIGSKAKQTVDREAAIQLLEEVNKFAEIFWKTKGIETKRVKAPYPPNEEVVYPVL